MATTQFGFSVGTNGRDVNDYYWALSAINEKLARGRATNQDRLDAIELVQELITLDDPQGPDVVKWITTQLTDCKLSDDAIAMLSDTLVFIRVGYRGFPLASYITMLSAALTNETTRIVRDGYVDRLQISKTRKAHLDKIAFVIRDKEASDNLLYQWLLQKDGLQDMISFFMIVLHPV